MGIQNWSENVILVNLAAEPQMSEELKTVIEIIRDQGNCDVVVDFAAVELVTSSSLAKLLKLHKALKNCGRQLILCSLNNRTRSVFNITELENIFEFAEDHFMALTSLQLTV